MKQLTCEMCGSTELVKQDGFFVCQTCGTKYSVEEAKKMMIEGTVDVQGTVRVDDSDKVNNYLVMAKNAYASSNNQEAEMYCNKIIEIDSTNSEAWLLKGVVAGWQSTGANLRMDEFLTCAKNAFVNAKDPETLTELAKIGYEECHNLTLAIFDMKLQHVVSYPNNWNEFARLQMKFLMWGLQVQEHYIKAFNSFYANVPEEEKKQPAKLWDNPKFVNINDKMNQDILDSGINLWNKAFKEYKESDDGYPSDYALDEMMKDGSVAMQMVQSVIPKNLNDIKDADKSRVIRACENLITMKKAWGDLKSYTISFSGGTTTHPVNKTISAAAKQQAFDDIRTLHETIKFCNPSHEIPKIYPRSEKELKKLNREASLIAYAIVGALFVGLCVATWWFFSSAI